MDEDIKKYLKRIVSIMIVAWLGYYLWKSRETFSATFDASWHQLIGLVICIVMTWLINCLQNFLLLRHLTVNVRIWENMILQMAMILGNYLPMRLGSLIRMRYLKKVHGLQYIKFAGTVGVRILVVFVYSLILFSIGIVELKFTKFSFVRTIFIIFVTIGVISLGWYLIKVSIKRASTNTFLLRKLTNFLTAFKLIQTNPLLFSQISGLVLLQLFMLALRFRISFETIHVELSPWVHIILASATTLISFLSLTPGNLGLREWIIGIASMAAGNDFSSGIFAGTVDRAVLIFCTFILGSGPLVWVWKRSARSISPHASRS